MADVDLTAELAKMRARRNRWHDTSPSPAVDFEDWATFLEASAEDIPVLLGVVDAVLKLADEWDAATIKTTAQLAEAGMPAAVKATESGDVGNPRSVELRAAIARTLNGVSDA